MKVVISITLIMYFMDIIWTLNSEHHLLKMSSFIIEPFKQNDKSLSLEKFSEFLEANLYNYELRRIYFILYTITSVGYGDSALPDLSNFHDDYTIIVINILFGFFMYSTLLANLNGLFGSQNLRTTLEIR